MFPFLFEFDQPNDAVLHHTGVERIKHELSPFFRENKPGLPEQIQMMRNRRLADLEMLGNRPGGEIAPAQQLENPPPRRIIQRFKQQVHNLDN